MKKKIAPLIRIIVIASILIGGWMIDQRRSAALSVLSGNFESQPVLVSSRVGGRVRSILVKEGDEVRADASVVDLDAGPEQKQSEALVVQARQAKLREQEVELLRQEDITRQMAVVAEARAALQKALNGPRPAEIAAARAAVQQSRARYAQVVVGSRPEEIDKAKAAMNGAKAKLQRAVNGATSFERQKAKADLESAIAQEDVAVKEDARRAQLAEQGAIAGKLADQAHAEAVAAKKKREAAMATLQNLDTRPEDIGIATSDARQAESAFYLAREGSRAEEIAAAKAALNQAKANLDLLLAGTRPEEISGAQARLDQAEAALAAMTKGSRNLQSKQAYEATVAAEQQAQSSSRKSDDHLVKATRAGVVERVLVADGDLVAAGQTLVRMSDLSDLHLRVFVPEGHLAVVHVGDTAKLEIDGVKDWIDGEVESVATQGEYTPANLQTPEERGKQVFAVRIRLKQPNRLVKPGIAATVRRIGTWEPGH